MREWRIDETELNQIVGPTGLPAYIIDSQYGAYLPIDEFANKFDPPFMDYEGLVIDMRFRLEDVENFKKENPQLLENAQDFSPNDARELGRLRQEKENWDESIKAAIKVGMFCLEKGKVLKRDEILSYLDIEFKELP
ncbi:MAG: hypothetical protein JRJ65_20470, partial [Deltaproteobacteria bacterium]|nr:hypothetical protein [Deltaproteobacteria bacterium]